MQDRKKQHGMTLIGWILTLAVAGVFFIMLVRLAPVYIEHYTITSTIKAVANESAGHAPAQIYDSLERRFEVNEVEVVSPHDVHIVNTGNRLSLKLNYEAQTPFMFNVYFLIKFSNSYPIGGK